jgi:16S rRNA (guanine527-N7)-methyltransferase
VAAGVDLKVVFHVKHADLGESASAMGIPVDSNQVDQLAAYEELLGARAVPLGIVARADAATLRERHVLDCLRAAPLVGNRVVDIGSGAGLPGIVVAVARPDATVHLVESRGRRVGFLELAVERLGLPNAIPVSARIEEVVGPFDTALARAFAGARASWVAAERVLGPAGRLVYFAGSRFQAAWIAEAVVRAEVVAAPLLLASSGPLVIMSRQ